MLALSDLPHDSSLASWKSDLKSKLPTWSRGFFSQPVSRFLCEIRKYSFLEFGSNELLCKENKESSLSKKLWNCFFRLATSSSSAQESGRLWFWILFITGWQSVSRTWERWWVRDERRGDDSEATHKEIWFEKGEMGSVPLI